MKKPKKIRTYIGDGRIFNTFQELKTYMYFHTCLNQKKISYELDEDVITKKYIFTKQERRLTCEKTYDKDVEELEKWKKNRVKMDRQKIFQKKLS